MNNVSQRRLALLSLVGLSHFIAKRTDALVVFVVIGVVFMMILPLPTGLVDFLIAVNISVSALLIVLALYLPGPLAFSTFPGLLLITTLFRLALSITTTRLILLQGDAGSIVEAFGGFVVGGNLVVGVVIFLILLIVNFMVITKGSERVAEVAARFTLDAMPGKQMSIDSDLRAGLLTAVEAQEKRKALAKESQLFGAMDGAMKFVKGDAIAGIIIVLVNIIGGFSIGVLQQGLPGGEAIKLYAILTIGDGLVAQIPALLIALTAGIIITRVKDDVNDKTNVGQEMAEQLISEPKAWMIASAVLVAFALIPGMPSAAFITLGIIFAAAGFFKNNLDKLQAHVDVKHPSNHTLAPAATPVQTASDQFDLNTFSVYERISLSISDDNATSPLLDEYARNFRLERNKIVLDLGYMLPSCKTDSRFELSSDEIILRFYEVPVLKATFSDKYVAVEKVNKDRLKQHGIHFTPGPKDRKEENILWVEATQAEQLTELDIRHVTPAVCFGIRVKEVLLRECYQFIGLEECNKIMRWATQDIPELAKEFERLMPLSNFSEILRRLASENVSLRSLRKIFETIINHASVEREISTLTELVRISLKDQICASIEKDGQIHACLFEPDSEAMLRDSLRKVANGGFFSLNQEEVDDLVKKVDEATQESLSCDLPVAMIVAQDLRPFLRDTLKMDIPSLPVISYSELSNTVSITPLARIDLLSSH